MTEVERLKARLVEMGTTNFGVFWGSDADKLTPEQRAAEINKALDALETGDYDIVDDDDEPPAPLGSQGEEG